MVTNKDRNWNGSLRTQKTRTLWPRSAVLSTATRKEILEESDWRHELPLPISPPKVTAVRGSIFKSCSGLPDFNKNEKFTQKHITHRNYEPHGAIPRNKRCSSSLRTGDSPLQDYRVPALPFHFRHWRADNENAPTILGFIEHIPNIWLAPSSFAKKP